MKPRAEDIEMIDGRIRSEVVNEIRRNRLMKNRALLIALAIIAVAAVW